MITPYAQIRRDAVEHNARLIHAAAALAAKKWVPRLSRCVPAEILSDVILPITDWASCGAIEDAETLAECGFRHIVMTRPVVESEALSRLDFLLRRVEMLVTIDHFRHAEMLSLAAVLAGQQIGVMLDVDLGRRTSGVRPGPDASRLAAAASTLPGIHVVGVHTDDGHAATRPHDEQFPPFNDMIAVAQHCLRTMANDGVRCREIATGRHSDFSLSCQHDTVTLIMCDPLGNSQSSAIMRTEEVNRLIPAVTVISRVISRPAFEWCVINAGTQIFGSSDTVAVLQPPGARVLTAATDASTLSLSDFALDLRIGDTVQLVMPHADEVLRNTGGRMGIV